MMIRAYNWGLGGFLVVILFAQVFGIFYTSVNSKQYLSFGQSPLNGLHSIDGYNDEPYSDRMIACVLHGHQYKPIQLNEALASSKSVVVDVASVAINGYRVCSRDQIQLESLAYTRYASVCNDLSSTLEGIFNSCTMLGYNVARDTLRIVDDVESSTMKLLINSLPVLIMPFWDNGIYARYAIPGWDGRKYNNEDESSTILYAIRTRGKNPGVDWAPWWGGKNGWYEDPSGMKWYSYMGSADPQLTYGIRLRHFDTMTNLELDCKSAECNPSLRTESWGVSVSFTEVTEMVNSIAASNGHRFGLFLFEALQIRSVISKYSIDILVSNMSLGLLLFRWSISIVAFQESVKAGVTEPTVLGIGCLSSSRCFSCLPLMLLPRLKTTFAAFFTVGCQFEGEQKAMAEAWFVIYPAIGEFLLFYFSLLSLVAKLSSRRMSDVLFGPTMVFFYLMHNLRFSLAQTGWFEFDGRIATVVSSEAFEKMALLDFFTTDAALRMNGNTKSLFLTKIIVLGLNLISFFWAKRSIPHSTTILEVEKSVAIQACNVGGLGRPFSYHQNYAISRRSRKCLAFCNNDTAG
uniref:Uncharacterized protein n=1 Tax=Globisporangium ultimum (strain ATCC 200006 / CBS 805.95 / DAOM BR144) TaxID=431595 RepID=K3WCH3_GLOUD